MKKILFEYINIFAYVIVGLAFGFSFFLLFLNFYHYKEVNTKVNHGLVIVKVKNSDDSYDYFQGNNSGFNPYIILDTKVTKDKNVATYLYFGSWQVSEPKLYRVTKFEKAAYKWGKAKKSSDLEKMYMNR